MDGQQCTEAGKELIPLLTLHWRTLPLFFRRKLLKLYTKTRAEQHQSVCLQAGELFPKKISNCPASPEPSSYSDAFQAASTRPEQICVLKHPLRVSAAGFYLQLLPSQTFLSLVRTDPSFQEGSQNPGLLPLSVRGIYPELGSVSRAFTTQPSGPTPALVEFPLSFPSHF